MPSSLTRVFPRTLGYSPRLPVSVFGTGRSGLARSFSRRLGSRGSARPRRGPPPVGPRPFARGICLPRGPRPSTGYSISRPALPSASLHRSNGLAGCRNVRLLPIACAQRLGLGPDSPRDDDRCPGNLRLSVGRILTALFATHTGILPSARSSAPRGAPSPHAECSPTHGRIVHAATSVPRLSPGNFRRRASRPVSYYALFKRWLLLSQRPGCF